MIIDFYIKIVYGFYKSSLRIVNLLEVRMSITRKTEVQKQEEEGIPHGLPTDDFLNIISRVRDSQIATLQKKVVSLTEEVSQWKARHRQLKIEYDQRIDRDLLTGAYNRNFLQKTAPKFVASKMRAKKPWGVLMADLDFFKRVNDNYEHDVGDELLKRVVRTLQCVSRDGDFVIRYGGDEFCILVCDIDTEKDLAILAERCRGAVDDIVMEVSISVTLSVGACFVPRNSSMELSHVIKRADKAMYRAKKNGRNCVKIFRDRRKCNRNCRKS